MSSTEETRPTFLDRRESISCAAGSNDGRFSLRISDGEVAATTIKEVDSFCRQNGEPDPSLDITASTASMNISFDTSFNSSNTDFRSAPPSTPMKSNGSGWGTIPEKSWMNTPQEIGLITEELYSSENDWDPFSGDFDMIIPSPESPDAKIPTHSSPCGINDMSSFKQKEVDRNKNSRSKSTNDLLRSLRYENERLKNAIKETSEEAGTLDAAEALVDDSLLNESTDESALENDMIDDSFYQGTVDSGIVDEGTLTTDYYTIDEGTASYYSKSQVEWDDRTSESDFESVTLESNASPKRTKRHTRNTMDAGPSSQTLRQALRRQRKTGNVSYSCPPVLEELKGTYEDASNAFHQIINAFFVSPDDVAKTSEVISGSKKQLRMSHTDKFVPKSTKTSLT